LLFRKFLCCFASTRQMIYQEDAYLHQSNHWLGRLSLKWAIMCQVEHKTLLYLFLYLFTGDWYEYCVSVLSFVLLASWTVYLPDYTPLLFVKVNFLFKRLLLVVICSFTPVDVVSHHTTSSSSFIVANWQHCLTDVKRMSYRIIYTEAAILALSAREPTVDVKYLPVF